MVASSDSHVQEQRAKRPIRPVLLQMPPQAATSQWGYAQIWKEGKACRSNDTASIEMRTLRRSKSTSRMVDGQNTGFWVHGGIAGPVSAGDGGLVNKCGFVAKDGRTRVRRTRSQERPTNLCGSSIYETIGSGVAHKVPCSGEYYGFGRFASADTAQLATPKQ